MKRDKQMKTIFKLIFFTGIILFTGSCSDDFLKKDDIALYSSSEPLIISSETPQSTVTLSIPDAGNHSFYIRTQPKWMQLEPLSGNFSDGTVTLQYSMSEPEYQTDAGYYTSWLIIAVDQVGYFQIEVIYGDIEQSDDPETPTVDEGDVTNIEGVVVDAAYDKNSDQMIIATKNPDQLLVVKTGSGVSSSISLDKTPKCIAISDDGKLYVGFTVAFLSVFDLSSDEQIKTYTLDCVPFDLALGENGWCYISPAGNSWDNLRSLNLETGTLVSQDNMQPVYSFYGNTILSKVKGKPLLAATRTLVSPTGFLLFDIGNGIPNDTITYWHTDVYNFWTNNDGSRLITNQGNVYFMPEYTGKYNVTETFNTYGKLELDRYYIADLDESAAKSCFFVASGDNIQEGYNQGETSVIQQFDATSLSLRQRYTPSMKVIEQNGHSVVAYHDIRYVFANSTGTRLYAVRRIAADFNLDEWSYEVFEVK